MTPAWTPGIFAVQTSIVKYDCNQCGSVFKVKNMKTRFRLVLGLQRSNYTILKYTPFHELEKVKAILGTFGLEAEYGEGKEGSQQVSSG